MSAGTESPPSQVVECPSCRTKNRVPAVARGKPSCANCHSPLPWVVDATDANFAAVTAGSTIPVLVDIWAPWCAPCRMVSPALQQLAVELAGRLKLVKVNADTSPQVSSQFDARSIPTLIILDEGRVVARQVGAAPLPALRSWVREHLESQR